MPAEIQVEVKLNGTQAKSTVDSIEQAYQHLKKELEKPVKVKTDSSALQKQINELTGVTKQAKSAAQSYEVMAKAEVSAVNKIVAAQQKLEIQQKRLDNKAILDQIKQRGKAWEDQVKALEQAAKAEEKLAAAQAKADSQAKHKEAQEAFKGYLERAKAAEQAAKAEEKLAAAHDKMGQSLGKIDAEQSKSLSTVAAFVRQQEGLSNATVKATGIIQNAAGTFQTYSASTKNADGTTQNFRVSVNTATGEVQMLDKGVKSASASFAGFGKQAMSFVKQLVGFYGIAQSLRKAFTEMKDMSDEMVIYRKVTNATAQDMEKIRASAYETAKKYGQSPSDFIASAANMARAGYKEQSMAMAELATRTQLVGDMTAEQASKFLIAVDAAYKYGGSIEQLSAVLDAANEIDNNFATSIEKISEGLTLVASVGSSAHVPIEQLMAALGTMTATTQRSGSEMARGLRSIILHVLGDTTTEIEEGVTASEEGIKTLTEALQEYGDESIKASIKAGKLINPMQAIVALQKAYKEGRIREADLYEIGKSVAGQRYYNAFSSLIMNPEMYESMLQSITASAGSAQKEIDAMMDSWSRKLEQLKTTWTELVNNTISEDFIKGLIDGAKSALEFAGNLQNLGTMALGAYAAIKSLSAGIGNLSKNQMFGSFNKWGIGLGIGIAAIGALKAYGENQFREATASAQSAASESDKIVSNAQQLNSLIERYKEITADGLNNDELDEAKSIQEQIKTLIGEQASNYDLLNGNVKQNIALLKQANIEYLKNALTAATSQRSSAGLALYNANANIPDRLTGQGLHFNSALEPIRINKGDVKPEVWNALLESEAFTTVIGYDKEKSSGRGHGGTFDRVPIAVEYGHNELRGITNQLLEGTYSGNFSADDVLERYDALVKVRQAYESAYTQAELETNDVYRSMASGIDHIKEAVESYRQSIQNEYAANAMLLLAEDDFVEKTFESKDAVKQYTDELAQSKGLSKDQAKALYDLASSMAEIKEAAASGEGGMEDATSSTITLASAIEKATAAKNAFDEAMKTTKADAFNDYTKAFETLQKEMEAGRVNSTAFYAAAEMLMGKEAYAATGGSSAAIIKALKNRTNGDSGSMLDAYNILTSTYTNKATGEAIEGYGFVELLRQTKGYGDKFITDKNGNIAIPALTSDQIADIANAWHIDSSFLMAAWNAFDQYDTQGERKQDDLMEQQQQETADASADAGEAVGTFADATVAASAAVEAAATSATNLSTSADTASAALDKLANSASQKDETKTNESPTLSDAWWDTPDGKAHAEKAERKWDKQKQEEAAANYLQLWYDAIAVVEQSVEEEKQEISEAIAADEAWLDTPDGRAHAAKAEKKWQEMQNGNTAKDDDEEEVSIFDDPDWIAINAKHAGVEAGKAFVEGAKEAEEDDEEDVSIFDDPDWIAINAKHAGVEAGKAFVEGAKEAEEDDEEDVSIFDDPDWIAINAKHAGEEAGEAFVEGAREAEDDEEEVSIFDDPDWMALNAKHAGEKAGDEFGEAYYKAMIQSAELYQQGEDIPSKYLEQLNKDMEESGGYIQPVIEKYKQALADLQGEASTLNEELGGAEEKEVEVEVDDEKAKKDISNLTATQTKTIMVKMVGGAAAFATGTRNHPGGLSLVNDGSGPELIVNDGNAFIAGGGKPTIVSLSKGAKVFTANETRQIFNGGIPAYAEGSTSELNLKDVEKKTGSTKSKTVTDQKSSSAPKVDEKAFSDLATMVDYIIGRIGDALNEQLEVIDAQIDALRKAREAAEEQNKLEELQKNVTDALNERTIRYLGEDGKWHWMADKKNVQQAQEALKEYQDELEFNAQVNELENQKNALQEEYNEITKTWSQIKDAVNTPTGSLSDLISQVLAHGTAQQKAGAGAVNDTLIKDITESVYTKNYDEALSAIEKATAGNPVMPGSGNVSLASLIATAGAGATEASISDALKTATSPSASITGSGNALAGGNQTNINYFIDGIKLGEGMENQPLSSIMKNLSVYTNTGVS